MPDEEKKESEARQPYTSSDVKPATEFLPDPPPRPGDQTRVVSPYRQGTHGESGTFPGGSVKDFRPHVVPSDVETETTEPEPVPKDSSAPESAESSTETESPEQTNQNASPGPAKIAASAVVKASGRRKDDENSSQTSSTSPKKKSGNSSPPAETPPQTSD